MASAQQDSTNPATARQLELGDEQTDPDPQPGQASQEEEEASEEAKEETNEHDNMASVTVNIGTPTLHKVAGDMFKSSTPKTVEEVENGSCDHPRSSRLGLDAQKLEKLKIMATAAPSQKFGLPIHLVTGKCGEDEGNGASAQEAQDTLVTVSYRAAEMQIRTKAWDLDNGLLIPTLDKTKCLEANTPAERWDFTERRHILAFYGSIDLDTVKQWSNDCIRWPKDDEDKRDQDWILTIARNWCTTELQMRIDRAFNKLPGCHQGGCVYLWMALDAMVRVDQNVAEALQAKLKSFGEKGLHTFVGENVESARIENLAISTRLDEMNMLPTNAAEDVLSGLSKASHPGFAKIFTDFKSTTLTTLTSASTLTCTVIEQVEQIWDEADRLYASFTLRSEWVAMPSAHYSKDGAAGVKCDNCLGPHYIRDCTQPRDEARITTNREARVASSGGRGGGRGRGGRGDRGGRGRGGNGGRGRGGNNASKTGYTRGRFGKPKENELVRKINGIAHAACKECGWNKGSKAHTTGSHDFVMDTPGSYTIRGSLKKEMTRLGRSSDDDDGDDDDTKAKGTTVGSGNSFSSILAAAKEMESQADQPEASAFAGQFRQMLGFLKE